jgi:TetR/AcrR family transcriptional regulator
MSDDRVERILNAAYECFARHGVRRTTMDDIAAAAEMSRAAVYQHVKNKDDVFRRLSSRMYGAASAEAAAAAVADRPLADRLHSVLSVKLELVLGLTSASPHAEELLGASTRLNRDLFEDYARTMERLVTGVVAEARQSGEIQLSGAEPGDIAELGLALVHGLANDPTDPDARRRHLRQGVELLVAGLTAPCSASHASSAGQ